MSITKVVKDKNMINMFNQLIGGDGDPVIVAEKEKNLNGVLTTIYKTLDAWATGPFAKGFPEYKGWMSEIELFSKNTKAVLEKKLPYKELKEDNQIKHIILVCSDLIKYKHYLESVSEARDNWVLTHPGLIFEPFKFTKLDVKHIWNNGKSTPKIKQYVLTYICLLFLKCKEVYGITTSPDIDVAQFSNVVVGAIGKVQNSPELSRCKDAFKKITDSVGMLENNFGGYYREMVQSKNPNTIIESFVLDVSNGNEMNPRLMMQFRTILNFYRKQQNKSGRKRDPKLDKLFKSLSSKMDLLDDKLGGGRRNNKKDKKDGTGADKKAGKSGKNNSKTV